MRPSQSHFTLLLQSKHIWAPSVHLNGLIFSKGIRRMFRTGSLMYCKEITQQNHSDLPKIKRETKSVLQKKPFNPPYVPEEDKKIVERLKTGDITYPYNTMNERFIALMKDDIIIERNKVVHLLTNIELGPLEKKYFPRQCDILVVGSGLVGVAAAYFILMEYPNTTKVVVVDKVPNCPETTLNPCAGTVTQQNFSHKEEIEMVKFSTDFLSSFSRHTAMPGHNQIRIPYDPTSSLVLADQTNADSVLKNREILNTFNLHTKLITKETLTQRYPWLNTHNLEFGCLSTYNEGLIDPWTIAMGLKCKIINMGSQFVTAEVVDFGMPRGGCKYAVCRLPDGAYTNISFGRCVIAAGMGSGSLIDAINVNEEILLKVRIPEEEKKSYEYCFYDPRGPGLNTPIVTNPDGVYFRREGLTGLYVAGVSNLSTEQGNEPHDVFENRIKPFLTSRLQGLEEVELRGGWVDTFTSNKANDFGVLGCHPFMEIVTFGIGFSRAGWVHALAAGKAIAEFLFYGKYKTIDMGRFNVERLWERQWREAEIARRKLFERKQREKLQA